MDFIRGKTFEEALRYAQSRGVKLPDEYYGKLAGIQRSQTVSIAGLASLEQIKFIIDQVEASLKKGGTFADFQKAVKKGELATDLPRHRLDNIYRTNLQAAYSRGRWEQQSRVRGTRPYLMYDAINDSRVRPTHLAMDNTILPWDHPWWKTHYTPNGYRCRCTTISLTEAQMKKRGGVTAVPPEADPDDGWDYNVGTDYKVGPLRGIERAVTAVKVVKPRLTATVDKAKKVIEDKAVVHTVDSIQEIGRKALADLPVVVSAFNGAAEFDQALRKLITEKVLKAKHVELSNFSGQKAARDHFKANFKGGKLRKSAMSEAGGLDEAEYIQEFMSSIPLPARWLKKTAAKYKTVSLNHSTKRASANQVTGLLTINHNNPSVMMHEFLHLVQMADPEVHNLTKEFHRQRTAGEQRVRLRDTTGNSAYAEHEVTRKDKYYDAYMGREYDGRGHGVGHGTDEPYEVLTMAIQALLSHWTSHSRSRTDILRLRLLTKDRTTAEFALGLLLAYA